MNIPEYRLDGIRPFNGTIDYYNQIGVAPPGGLTATGPTVTGAGQDCQFIGGKLICVGDVTTVPTGLEPEIANGEPEPEVTEPEPPVIDIDKLVIRPEVFTGGGGFPGGVGFEEEVIEEEPSFIDKIKSFIAEKPFLSLALAAGAGYVGYRYLRKNKK